MYVELETFKLLLNLNLGIKTTQVTASSPGHVILKKLVLIYIRQTSALVSVDQKQVCFK